MQEETTRIAHRRGPWSQQEDELLMTLVDGNGAINWVRIASAVNSRTPKQCRERYHQNLKPSLNHDPITAEEGAQIQRLVRERGKKWADIARLLVGRSDNAVKNWWNGNQNRRKRYDRRRNVSIPSSEDCYRQSLSVGGAQRTLPLPGAMQSPLDHRHPTPSWPDGQAPLPSPCSSESPEIDGRHHYRVSSSRAAFISLPPLELPPLRTLRHEIIAPMQNGVLPSLGTIAPQPCYNDTQRRSQLITAPNSPVQQQQTSDQSKKSRISVSSLLG